VREGAWVNDVHVITMCKLKKIEKVNPTSRSLTMDS
jgi:hypothetical protein